MPIDILMPTLFPAMRAGRVLRWRVAAGQDVENGNIIAEIEAGGTGYEVATDEAGTVSKLLIAEGGAAVAVGTPIAELSTSLTTGNRPAAAATGSRIPGRPISPLARRLAREATIDFAEIAGSGPGGRIVKRDVELAVRRIAKSPPSNLAGPSQPAKPVTQSAPSARVIARSSDSTGEGVLIHYRAGTYDIVQVDELQRAYADRALLSARAIPQLKLSVDLFIDALLAKLEQLNQAAIEAMPSAEPIVLVDAVAKAMALSFLKVPAANATWSDIGILRHRTCDIGLNLAHGDGSQLPVIRSVEQKSLSELANERAQLARAADRGLLERASCAGGTTAIFDFSRCGVRAAEPLIMAPHASAVSLGTPEARAIMKSAGVQAANLMTCTLACDLRVISSTTGAAFLNAIKGFVENPGLLLL